VPGDLCYLLAPILKNRTKQILKIVNQKCRFIICLSTRQRAISPGFKIFIQLVAIIPVKYFYGRVSVILSIVSAGKFFEIFPFAEVINF
jgi:hypothetical protein